MVKSGIGYYQTCVDGQRIV